MVSLKFVSVTLAAILFFNPSTSAAFTNQEYIETFAPCLVDFAKAQFNVDISLDDVQTSVSRFDYAAVLDLIKAQNVEDPDLERFFASDGVGNCTRAYFDLQQWDDITGGFVLSQDCMCLELQELTSNADLPCDEIGDKSTNSDLKTAQQDVEDAYRGAGFDITLPENADTYQMSVDNCANKVNLLHAPNAIIVVNPDEDHDTIQATINAVAEANAAAVTQSITATDAPAEDTTDPNPTE